MVTTDTQTMKLFLMTMGDCVKGKMPSRSASESQGENKTQTDKYDFWMRETYFEKGDVSEPCSLQ